jgi:hypothetical protein
MAPIWPSSVAGACWRHARPRGPRAPATSSLAAVPDCHREEALREIFERLDVDGPEIVAAHPQPNENAWLLGQRPTRPRQAQLVRSLLRLGGRPLESP